SLFHPSPRFLVCDSLVSVSRLPSSMQRILLRRRHDAVTSATLDGSNIALDPSLRTLAHAIDARYSTIPESCFLSSGDAKARRWPDRVGLLTVCLLAFFLGTSRLTDEWYMTGPTSDAPRYLMNSTYMLDVLHDRPFSSVTTLLDYTRLY